MSDESPLLPTPEELSHAVLLALLMQSGGSVTIPATALESDAVCTRDGAYHALSLTALPDGQLRVAPSNRAPLAATEGSSSVIDRRTPGIPPSAYLISVITA
ncbi:hypothetical protein ACIBBE_42945 [Streptomyces sp. NPDC051644]|uniref:hypothetical protein n=1 Tax=Streptomyces sp. NPDC051644 TaxID=3365666 RepID=UPI0037AA44D5